MRRIVQVRFTRNVLAPSWILIFGCVSLTVRPLGLVTSLTLVLMGVVVVPALMLIPGLCRRD